MDKAGKFYFGQRIESGARVLVDDGSPICKALPPRNDLSNHSPDGFEWGYGGSGPAQLALALLADATGNDALALEYHQRFKFAHVARLSGNTWQMTQQGVCLELARLMCDA